MALSAEDVKEVSDFISEIKDMSTSEYMEFGRVNQQRVGNLCVKHGVCMEQYVDEIVSDFEAVLLK